VPVYLLDTNICIYIRQNRPSRVATRFHSLQRGEAVMSMISFGELCYGAQKSRAQDRALALLSELSTLIPVEPLPVNAAMSYGVLRAELEHRGVVISNNDFWIAAHAQTAGLTLVTNNEREFRRVPDLRVENWAAG
jgi:tRNA(fMet)-specific endonuclease VapC